MFASREPPRGLPKCDATADNRNAGEACVYRFVIPIKRGRSISRLSRFGPHVTHRGSSSSRFPSDCATLITHRISSDFILSLPVGGKNAMGGMVPLGDASRRPAQVPVVTA